MEKRKDSKSGTIFEAVSLVQVLILTKNVDFFKLKQMKLNMKKKKQL